MATMGDPVEFWFNEVKEIKIYIVLRDYSSLTVHPHVVKVSDFNPTNIKPFENSKLGSPPTGHYTQVGKCEIDLT